MAQLILPEGEQVPFCSIQRSPPKIGAYILSVGHSGGLDKARGAVLRLGRITQFGSDYLKTDAVLIGGDSGGPVFSMNGRLLAIHSRVGTLLSSNMCVPIALFLKDWERLKKSEFIGQGPFAPHPVMEFGVRLDTEPNRDPQTSLAVLQVDPDSIAGKLGIVAGDWLLKVNGKECSTYKALTQQLIERANEELEGEEPFSWQVTVEREGKPLELEYEATN